VEGKRARRAGSSGPREPGEECGGTVASKKQKRKRRGFRSFTFFRRKKSSLLKRGSVGGKRKSGETRASPLTNVKAAKKQEKLGRRGSKECRLAGKFAQS